jgi:hypothetical protein
MILFWREIVIAALVAALGVTGKLYLGKRDEVAEVTARHLTALDQAKAARDDVKQRSETALAALKVEHEQNIKEVERNAWLNFKRRYPDFAGRVQPQPAMPGLAATRPADSPRAPDAAPAEPMATFVTACATDAATIAEYQRWVRLNKLPVEGE